MKRSTFYPLIVVIAIIFFGIYFSIFVDQNKVFRDILKVFFGLALTFVLAIIISLIYEIRHPIVSKQNESELPPSQNSNPFKNIIIASFVVFFLSLWSSVEYMLFLSHGYHSFYIISRFILLFLSIVNIFLSIKRIQFSRFILLLMIILIIIIESFNFGF